MSINKQSLDKHLYNADSNKNQGAVLSEKTKILLGYVPSAVFPALIFPAIILDENASFVSHDNPKIIAIIVAIIIGYLSKNILATILSGLISYWIIIFLI